MHDVVGPAMHDQEFTKSEVSESCQKRLEAELRRQAALHEFCHRHRKRDLDAYREALTNWRVRLWRSWLIRQATRLSRAEEDLVRQSGLLDEGWYRLRYPNATQDLSRHYVTTGALEGADPHPLFDTDWYLEQNTYPRKNGINPLVHYLTAGWQRGSSPHPLFDVKWYLSAYPEVAERGVEPLSFYLNEGWQAGHQPHPLFNGPWYRQRYPEVEAAGVEPLTHYVTQGVLKGYLPHPAADAGQGRAVDGTRKVLLSTLRRQHRGELEQRLKRMLEKRNFQSCIEAFENFTQEGSACSEDFSFASQRAYAKALAREGRATEAIRLAETLVGRAPRTADRYSLLGFLLVGEDPPRARVVLRRALELGSRSMADIVLLIHSYQIEQKDPIEALDDLEAFQHVRNLSHKRQARDDYHMAMAAIHAATDKRMSLEWLNRYFNLYSLAGLTVPNADSWTMDTLGFQAEPGRDEGPLVTVLMTSYNAEKHVEAAIRSVLNQTYRNLEVILVDDCSTDRTVVLAEAIARSDRRLRVLVNRHNVGTYASKNVGLRLSSGAFITCHDSDDISHPEKIARQVRVLQRKPHIAATISRWCRMDDSGSLISKRWGRIVHENPSSLMYRWEVVEALGYYDCVRTSADTEYQERIRTHFGRRSIVKLPECMAFGRDRLDSLTVGSRFGFDNFGASPLRQAYWRNMIKWHEAATMNGTSDLFLAFPPRNGLRPFAAPEEMQISIEAIRDNCEAHGLLDT